MIPVSLGISVIFLTQFDRKNLRFPGFQIQYKANITSIHIIVEMMDRHLSVLCRFLTKFTVICPHTNSSVAIDMFHSEILGFDVSTRYDHSFLCL